MRPQMITARTPVTDRGAKVKPSKELDTTNDLTTPANDHHPQGVVGGDSSRDDRIIRAASGRRRHGGAGTRRWADVDNG
jgi:hypothetical protein